MLGLALVSGCSLFAELFAPQPSASPAAINGPDQAQVDAEALAELDALRSAAAAPEAGTEALLAYAEAHCYALEHGLFERLGGGEDRSAELGQWLDAALERQPELAGVRGRLHAARGESEHAAQIWLAALQHEGSPELFNALAGLPRSVQIDAAVVDGCALVRRQIDESELPEFIGLCLERAGGDGSRLAWASASADIAAYERTMAEREQAALAAQTEQERLARERMWLMATMFATGRCNFSDCLTEGWDTDTPAGTLRSRCNFSDCLKEGWTTEFPDGTRAETRCKFSDCATDGWDTRLPDGSNAETRCNFSNCFEDGWDTRLSSGTAEGRCMFSKCFEDGWSVDPPEGPRFDCRCRFGDCLTDGNECG